MRRILSALCVVIALGAAPAVAATFTFAGLKPQISITVPDRWNPNSSDDGVDAAAPDNGAFFSVYVADEDDGLAVRREALEALMRNGMKIDFKSLQESKATLAGVAASQSRYAATEDGKPKIVITDVAHLSGRSYIQLFQWGTPQGLAKNRAALDSIFASLKRLRK